MRLEGRGQPFGALIVAKPRAELSDRLNTLLERLALALLGGILSPAHSRGTCRDG